MPRTVIIGDVHGCLHELRALLDRIALRRDDGLYFVGDLVARGPETVDVLDLIRKLGGRSVRGNHEQKLLSAERGGRKQREARLGPTHRALLRQMRADHWQMLREMPAWIDLPEHQLRIVHAGVLPGTAVEQTEPRILSTIRGLSPKGEPSAQRSAEPWAKRYHGPPHVVFGHNALLAPQLHQDATGIDTGCVYGGFLTAVVLQQGQRVPPIHERNAVLVMVPAREAYAAMRVSSVG